jgi:hypothetical protein
MTEVTAAPVIVDDLSAPEFFASFIAGAAFDSPNVRLTFVSSRVSHVTTPAPVNNVVNVRIVMSIPAAQQKCKFLSGFLQSADLNATQKPPEQSLQ